MAEQSLAEIAAKNDAEHSAALAYKVLYDGQCEICQACVAWLKTLDRENKTLPLAISPEVLSTVDSRLRLEECLRQLHVVTPEGEMLVGWDAVASLARLFPATWLIGTLGQWFLFRNIGGFSMVLLPRTDIRLASAEAVRAESLNQKQYDAKPGCWRCDTNDEPIVLPLPRHPFVPLDWTRPASSSLWRDR